MINYSINPITKTKYKIPTKLNDSVNLNKFINYNKGKKVIVVQGLGFVGAVMSLVCANSDHEHYAVIGVDLPNKENYWKIKSINSGEFPVIASDPKIEKFYSKALKKKIFMLHMIQYHILLLII